MGNSKSLKKFTIFGVWYVDGEVRPILCHHTELSPLKAMKKFFRDHKDSDVAIHSVVAGHFECLVDNEEFIDSGDDLEGWFE